MLKPRPRKARVVDAVAQCPLTRLGKVRHERVVGVHDEPRGGGERRDRGTPTLRDVLELAVAVELVAKEIAERDDPRSYSLDHLG